MTWDEKIKMVELLNDGSYEDAVAYISGKEVDNQAMDMFVTGFSLTQMKLLHPIKDLIVSFDSSKLDWRSSIRLETMKEYFQAQEENKKEKLEIILELSEKGFSIFQSTKVLNEVLYMELRAEGKMDGQVFATLRNISLHQIHSMYSPSGAMEMLEEEMFEELYKKMESNKVL